MLIEALIFACLLGAAVVFLAPDRYAHKLAFGLSVPPLLISLYMYLVFDGSGNALLGGEIAYETFTEWL